EPDDSRGNQRVFKLRIVRIVAVNAKQGYALEQIVLHGLPVINIHELAGDQPAGDGAFGHPRVSNGHEVAIKPRQATERNAGMPPCMQAQAGLFLTWQVMMSDIRRVADYEIALVIFRGRRRCFREIRDPQIEWGFAPQLHRVTSMMWIDFNAP